jgi:predicted transcriptional regulator
MDELWREHRNRKAPNHIGQGHPVKVYQLGRTTSELTNVRSVRNLPINPHRETVSNRVLVERVI